MNHFLRLINVKKIYFLIATSIIIFDQFTKYLIIKHIAKHDAIDVLPFFRIVHVTNKGAAFGSLQELGNPFFIVISLVAIFIVMYLILKGKENPLGLSFILGGAVGNLIDRLRFGYVIDFLDVFVGSYHWPAFNVADSFLSIGIVVMLITYLIAPHKKNKQSS